MITALGTLVFIHKRQRLQRHQALRDYYFEQMELSRVHTTLTVHSIIPNAGGLPGCHIPIASVDPSLRYTTQLRTVARERKSNERSLEQGS